MMESKSKGHDIIHQKKLMIAIGLTIWVFFFLTTISKSYSWVVHQNMDVSINFLIVRAFWTWMTIALFSPLFIVLARLLYQENLTAKVIGMHILLSVLLVPVYSSFYFVIMMIVWHTEAPWTQEYFFEAMNTVIVQFTLVGPLSYALIVTVWYFKKYYENYINRELNNAEMETELSSMRLQVLKTQLHPHFLFNTLHNVNSLIHENISKAERILALLKRFLEISITRVSEHRVLLADELEFTGTYLEIEKTRFSDRLSVETQIDADTLEVMVPSFLLQPLVENAVRHGIAKRAGPGTIRITAYRKDKRLRLCVEDSGPGLVHGKVSKGIGLSNIEERLSHLYDNYVFSIQSSELGGLQVLIEFPLNDNLKKSDGLL